MVGTKAIDVSVVICTRDRAEQLREVLSSFLLMQIPQELRWELCIVDNGSSDHTAGVIESFESQLPIRRVLEEEAGLSNARNRGVEVALGQYVCWTDDDVVLSPGWLSAYWQMIQTHPNAVLFGGPILPQLEAPTPPWFSRYADRWPLTTVLAKREFGPLPRRLSWEEGVSPWGANYAIRSDEQRKYRYDPQLGVSPRQRRLGEEADVIARVLSAGGEGWWVPAAVVHHKIPIRRQSRDYLYEYYVANGETLAYLEARHRGNHPMITGRKVRKLLEANRFKILFERSLLKSAYKICSALNIELRSLMFLQKVAVIDGVRAFRIAERSRG